MHHSRKEYVCVVWAASYWQAVGASLAKKMLYGDAAMP